eukprot:5741579-Amphidinium_carterae.2
MSARPVCIEAKSPLVIGSLSTSVRMCCVLRLSSKGGFGELGGTTPVEVLADPGRASATGARTGVPNSLRHRDLVELSSLTKINVIHANQGANDNTKQRDCQVAHKHEVTACVDTDTTEERVCQVAPKILLKAIVDTDNTDEKVCQVARKVVLKACADTDNTEEKVCQVAHKKVLKACVVTDNTEESVCQVEPQVELKAEDFLQVGSPHNVGDFS